MCLCICILCAWCLCNDWREINTYWLVKATHEPVQIFFKKIKGQGHRSHRSGNYGRQWHMLSHFERGSSFWHKFCVTCVIATLFMSAVRTCAKTLKAFCCRWLYDRSNTLESFALGLVTAAQLPSGFSLESCHFQSLLFTFVGNPFGHNCRHSSWAVVAYTINNVSMY